MNTNKSIPTGRSHVISGFRIPIVEVPECTNHKFFSQKKLFALGTLEAYAELQRRADIINARKGN